MRMKSKASLLMLLAAVALTGCTSGQQPVSGDANYTPKASPSAEVIEGQLGELKTELKDIQEEVPEVDNGLIISLPTAMTYDVVPNEKVTLTVGGLPPETEAYIYVFYHLNGNNSATLNLGRVTVDKDGSVNEQVNVPKNLAPGLFSLTLEDKDKNLYVANINIKE